MADERVRLELRILGQSVRVDVPRPEGRIRLDQILPFLNELDDRLIDASVKHVESQGEKVSCAKGCSACCRRQPVPVTPPEAYALSLLVERLPEPRRTEVRQRFQENVRALEAAGLAEVYLHRDPNVTREQARAVAIRYHSLGLVCPFLEDDACGIYFERPLVCRQYLVTSPASLCTNPLENPVRTVPIAIRPVSAVLAVASQTIGRPQFTVPLALALSYASEHAVELGTVRDAAELFQAATEAVLGPPR